MDTTPLPNRECDESDNGQEDYDSQSTSSLDIIYYVVRITSCSKFTFDQLKSFFQNENQICRYVIGRELVPQEHFHLVLGLDSSLELQDVKDIVRAFLCPLWQTSEGKMPRGFGNKQYNCQVAEDKDNAVSYAVKLKEYVYEGFTKEYIASRVAEAFEKKKPSNFKAEYQDLLDKYDETDMDIDDFMIEFVRLKAKYGQMVNVLDAYKYALSALIRKEPDQAAGIVKEFLRKV